MEQKILTHNLNRSTKVEFADQLNVWHNSWMKFYLIDQKNNMNYDLFSKLRYLVKKFDYFNHPS